MNFTERIRWTRRKTGMSQAELARKLGVNRSAVANWEAIGPTGPNYGNLMRLATVAHVSIEWLAAGRGESTLEPHLHSVPAVDADLVEAPDERRLLRAYRDGSLQSRTLVLDLADHLARHRNGKAAAR